MSRRYQNTSGSEFALQISIPGDRLAHESGVILAQGTDAILVSAAVLITHTVPIGTIVNFDETEANGPAIESGLQAAGFTLVT